MDVSSPSSSSVLVSYNVLVLIEVLRGLGRFLLIIRRRTAILSSPIFVINIVFWACGRFAGLQDSLEACAKDLLVGGHHDWFTLV